jgi:hypothetical protein
MPGSGGRSRSTSSWDTSISMWSPQPMILMGVASRKQSLLGEPRLPGYSNWKNDLVFPARPSRHLGFRHAAASDSGRHQCRWKTCQSSCSIVKAGIRVRIRSRDRETGLAYRRASSPADRCGRRMDLADTTDSKQTSGFRCPGSDTGQHHQLHSSTETNRASIAPGLQDRSDLHAAHVIDGPSAPKA